MSERRIKILIRRVAQRTVAVYGETVSSVRVPAHRWRSRPWCEVRRPVRACQWVVLRITDVKECLLVRSRFCKTNDRQDTSHHAAHTDTFVLEWSQRLTRLTSELGEQASRNAGYSKHPCHCLPSGVRASPLKRDPRHLKPSKVTDWCGGTPSPSLPRTELASFLLVPGCLVMTRLCVLVSAGMFGPAVLIGPVCPQSVPEPARVPANKTRKSRNVPTPEFTVITGSSDWDCTTAKGKHKNSCCVTTFHRVS